LANDAFLKALDDCLLRLRAGEPLEQCLDSYPRYRTKLEPLLKTAHLTATFPRVQPDAERRQALRARVISRLSRPVKARYVIHEHTAPCSHLAFRILAPVCLAVILILVSQLALPIFSPEPVYAATFTLSKLNGTAEAQPAGTTGWMATSNNITLPVGSRVRTAPGSYALLTFFDGSTTKLEPETEIMVNESLYLNQQQVRISLNQPSGKTWSHIVSSGDDKPYFAIQTPELVAVAQGTTFITEVDRTGLTRVSVAEGTVAVTSRDKTVNLAADQEVKLGKNALSATPIATVIAKNVLLVSTSLAGISSVRDPNGASTGVLPDGLAFNQITSASTAISADTQVIAVKEVISGEYTITVRCLSAEPIPLKVQIRSAGNAVFEQAEVLKGIKGDGWTVRLKVIIGNDATASAKVVSVERLSEKNPETIVETNLARQRAVPITSIAAATSLTPNTAIKTTMPPSTSNDTAATIKSTPETAKPTATPTTIPTTTQSPTTDSGSTTAKITPDTSASAKATTTSPATSLNNP
jgi:hypothetical protein